MKQDPSETASAARKRTLNQRVKESQVQWDSNCCWCLKANNGYEPKSNTRNLCYGSQERWQSEKTAEDRIWLEEASEGIECVQNSKLS